MPSVVVGIILDEFIFNVPLDEIVKFVPSPSIFSPSSPNVTPTLAGILISPVAVKLISAPEDTVKSVPSPVICSPPLSEI